MKNACMTVVIAALALAGCGSSDDESPAVAEKASPTVTETASATPTATASAAPLPEQRVKNERDAAERAGCTLENLPEEGNEHVDKIFTAADYDSNPPTSGPHYPQWADDGIYAAGEVPQLGELVHTLEHGRIDVQYAPGTSPEVIAQLVTLVGENDGYHMLLFENDTDMPAAVAATAWTWSLTCPEVTDKTWDALRTFRDKHVDQGPELVP